MAILVIGSTGPIGSLIVKRLLEAGVTVHALTRRPQKASFPREVHVVPGDLMDVEAIRAALAPASTLFLLNTVTPDELTQALIVLNLAREAGIQRIVYFSVLNSDQYTNVPHFSAKHTVERMIEQFRLPATILRPAYFMQNDSLLKEALQRAHVYPVPVGNIGLAMIDTRDIADIAAYELLRRERAVVPLPPETIDLAGPECLTGGAIASIWSDALGQTIHYAGDDTAAYEQAMGAFMPAWMAFDMRMMAERFQSDGMVATQETTSRFSQLIGRPLRRYREFAVEMAAQWKNPLEP